MHDGGDREELYGELEERGPPLGGRIRDPAQQRWVPAG